MSAEVSNKLKVENVIRLKQVTQTLKKDEPTNTGTNSGLVTPEKKAGQRISPRKSKGRRQISSSYVKQLEKTDEKLIHYIVNGLQSDDPENGYKEILKKVNESVPNFSGVCNYNFQGMTKKIYEQNHKYLRSILKDWKLTDHRFQVLQLSK